MRLITIEFTEDTFRDEAQTDDDGNLVLDGGEPVMVRTPVRAKGERLHVDPRSAKSFCDLKKVAKRIGTTTDDDKSNDQVPAAPVGDVDTPVSETPAGEQGNDAAGETPPAEQAATPRSRRGTSTS